MATERARRSSLTTTRASPGRSRPARSQSDGSVAAFSRFSVDRALREVPMTGGILNRGRRGRRSKATVARASTPQKRRGLGRWRPHESPCGTWLACVRPDICLPRLNKACPNPSKWRESLGIRGALPTARLCSVTPTALRGELRVARRRDPIAGFGEPARHASDHHERLGGRHAGQG